jgi:alanyl-tRNA synthetase
MGGKSKDKRIAWSVELCGGTHLKDTGEAILFKIIQETGVSSGVRRIEALTRKSAIDFFRSKNDILDSIVKKLNTQYSQVTNKLEQLINEKDQLKQEINRLKKENLTQNSTNSSIDLNGILFEAKVYDDLVPKELKQYAEKLLNSKKLDVVCIISKFNEKVSCVINVNANLLKKFDAIELVNVVAENVDGSRGGGRPDMAQAGGQNIKKIDFALEKLKNFIKERI